LDWGADGVEWKGEGTEAMEYVIGLGLGMDGTLAWVNREVVDRWITPEMQKVEPLPHGRHYSEMRQYLVLWAMLYVGTMIMYLGSAGLTYHLFYRTRDSKTGQNLAKWEPEAGQLRNEISTSATSLIFITAAVAPFELMVARGWTKVYWNVEDHGWAYLLVSPLLFLVFTDACIYWIHRILHHRWFYAPLHKLHHKYKETTPFSAFAFHPLDGWLQGVPYHIFVFLMPFHHITYGAAMLLVGLWTINIHDRIDLDLPGVNGAGHHTLHHQRFNYNYGQYFVHMDKLCGTHLDPYGGQKWSIYPSRAEKNLSAGKPKDS